MNLKKMFILFMTFIIFISIMSAVNAVMNDDDDVVGMATYIVR